MPKKIHVKAVLLGGLVSFILAFILQAIVDSTLSDAVYDYLDHNPKAHDLDFLRAMLIVNLITSGTGGYVAARVAKSAPILQALLSGLVIFIVMGWAIPKELQSFPAWFSLLDIGMTIPSFVFGGVVMKLFQKKAMGIVDTPWIEGWRFKNYLAAACLALILVAASLVVGIHSKMSPPAAVIKVLESRAEQGDPTAEVYVATLYFFGRGVEKDPDRALSLYTKAARQGDASGQYELGELYYSGFYLTQSYEDAYKWLTLASRGGEKDPILHHMEKAKLALTPDQLSEADEWLAAWKPMNATEATKITNSEDADAQYREGLAMFEGDGVIKDQDGGLKRLRQAADNHSEDAENLLGDLYFYGNGVAQDYAEALKYYKEAAQDYSSQPAENMLGKIYEHGFGVPQNYQTAALWYQKAAENTFADAELNLGILYMNGTGVPQSDKEAAAWFHKAVVQHVPMAELLLGEMYVAGKGLNKDCVEGFSLIAKAAIQKLPQAERALGLLYAGGLCVVRDEVHAADLYQRAAEQGDIIAATLLGNALNNGIGRPKDSMSANIWWEKAAINGDPEAQTHLGSSYVKGLGVDKDLVRAYMWLMLATKKNYDPAKTILPTLEKQMTPDQLAKAKTMVRDWKSVGN